MWCNIMVLCLQSVKNEPMPELIIEKGIEPPISVDEKLLATKIYNDFEINDSSFVSGVNINNLMNELRKISQINESKIKFKKITAQKDNVWGFRVWRIS